MEIGVVGKPNVGKSTFFSSATLVQAEIANYPFTTIDANKGVMYVQEQCPEKDFELKCTPGNAGCEDGTRFIPVEAIDVAGLVPDAYQGKGLGNQFLNHLSMAHGLIHIIDASGSTDAEGNPLDVGTHDPLDDVEFLEKEISWWIKGILTKDWKRMSRQLEAPGTKLERVFGEKLNGIGVNENHMIHVLRNLDLGEKPSQWTEEELFALSDEIRSVSKPIILAANKADLAPPENIKRLQELEGYTVIPTIAEAELALRRAAKAGMVSYLPGDSTFEIVDESKLNPAQLKGLEKIKEAIERNGGTGVQKCIQEVIFDVLDLMVVYPVEDENKMTDKKGRVLPDAFLMKTGATAKEMAFKVHTDLGNNFIRAIDARTKRVVGADHELKNRDVIKIVSNA
jgi:ribosome-binding ATPase YchF (GTP1/OBG family)